MAQAKKEMTPKSGSAAEMATKSGVRFRAHRIVIRRGYSIWEEGDGYGFEPWSNEGAYYEGYSEPVVIELSPRARLCRVGSGGRWPAIKVPDYTIPVESISLVLYLKYAKVVPGADPEQYPDALELLGIKAESVDDG